MIVILLSLLLGPCLGGRYVPGTPGAPWTTEEMVMVKAKLYNIFRGNAEMGPQALRLGFHDCLRYKDGTGGCDGCLNWHNVGTRRPMPQWASCEWEQNVNMTDNNGMEKIVKTLELIYTKRKSNMPALKQSLRDSGKSRADLWAYASMVAAEFGTHKSNMACENKVRWNCVHESYPECMIKPTRSFNFESGRADCIEHDSKLTYKATKEEVHPSANHNGRTTVQFFKKNFDFTGRETAAIFGAHSFSMDDLTCRSVDFLAIHGQLLLLG